MGKASAIIALISVCSLAGCASTQPPETTASISPEVYKGYSCQQVAEQAPRALARINELSSRQAQLDAADVAASVTTFILLPISVGVPDDGTIAAELQQRKNEYAALAQASGQKGCGVQFPQPA